MRLREALLYLLHIYKCACSAVWEVWPAESCLCSRLESQRS